MCLAAEKVWFSLATVQFAVNPVEQTPETGVAGEEADAGSDTTEAQRAPVDVVTPGSGTSRSNQAW